MKGQKTGGRAKGVTNKVTNITKDWINEFLGKAKKTAYADFALLDPYQKFMVIDKLLSYVLSKKTDITTNENDLLPPARPLIIEYRPRSNNE